MKTLDELLEQAAGAIGQARHLTAFSGAGISVESGIPPFRGPGGVWEKYDPEILDLDFFVRHPETSWAAIHALFTSFLGTDGRPPVAPNAAHRVLAKWEAEGRLQCTITQNFDGLHAAAGSRKLVEYHGHCRTMTCLSCGLRVPLDPSAAAAGEPRCACGGVDKPDLVFFGDGSPFEASREAERAARLTDCL
ncbi:MAG: RNA polymerase subunit sigma, partial [Kiritimatiellae bacterium]|nr:RNA polymerase subunit sigma [Kiritimatiellia bacterium]